MSMKKILILEILSDDDELKAKDEEVQGPYVKMFAEAMDIGEDRFVFIDASKKVPNNPSEYSGIIIGRSTYEPIEGKEKPWMKEVYEFIRKTVKAGVPLLGICGGLEFTARALGGEVVPNPKGKEFGSFDIKLNEDGKKDPLFENMPEEFMAQVSHGYSVEELKDDWKVLGSSEMCNNQVIAIGDKVRLVQFHPEIKPIHLENLAKMRNLEVETKESPHTKQILRNFLKNFVE
ncbi:MAG: hypothetical protein COV31_01800 [Candidatus Yanofskybacteria bacterium CG10_big_fil_rev_8_21_14_0_10_46_23]|uniref:Glutamine amidotransferase domain-containing protein n=1 Tax=Candidatus Yanofskybacteria bacterium CG10_big_fil_rev_8_21_14_0_10_46_23 TaxID=1975098 RepID=A0A2H0R487_9BACT|nr:MAG: hypothetical protein COV31_01800 [Candidatus Yanofskybacteria bacterium CG10_big_fil_rev_8_21_14_0_10_46_23]